MSSGTAMPASWYLTGDYRLVGKRFQRMKGGEFV